MLRGTCNEGRVMPRFSPPQCNSSLVVRLTAERDRQYLDAIANDARPMATPSCVLEQNHVSGFESHVRAIGGLGFDGTAQECLNLSTRCRVKVALPVRTDREIPKI
jgi:hypothetical protein